MQKFYERVKKKKLHLYKHTEPNVSPVIKIKDLSSLYKIKSRKVQASSSPITSTQSIPDDDLRQLHEARRENKTKVPDIVSLKPMKKSILLSKRKWNQSTDKKRKRARLATVITYKCPVKCFGGGLFLHRNYALEIIDFLKQYKRSKKKICLLLGSTACGKTTLMKELFFQNSQHVQPVPIEDEMTQDEVLETLTHRSMFSTRGSQQVVRIDSFESFDSKFSRMVVDTLKMIHGEDSSKKIKHARRANININPVIIACNSNKLSFIRQLYKLRCLRVVKMCDLSVWQKQQILDSIIKMEGFETCDTKKIMQLYPCPSSWSSLVRGNLIACAQSADYGHVFFKCAKKVLCSSDKSYENFAIYWKHMTKKRINLSGLIFQNYATVAKPKQNSSASVLDHCSEFMDLMSFCDITNGNHCFEEEHTRMSKELMPRAYFQYLQRVEVSPRAKIDYKVRNLRPPEGDYLKNTCITASKLDALRYIALMESSEEQHERQSLDHRKRDIYSVAHHIGAIYDVETKSYNRRYTCISRASCPEFQRCIDAVRTVYSNISFLD